MRVVSVIVCCLLLVGCGQSQSEVKADNQNGASASATNYAIESARQDQLYVPVEGSEIVKVEKSRGEWKELLTEEEFYILRQSGTERAFTSELLNNKEEGVYTCAGCGLPLFGSDAKFKSGSGWPSFYQPIEPEHVSEHDDLSYGMRRVELRCARCDGHLGHVFNDGPAPTGLRYCINGDGLDFLTQEAIKEKK